jgi:hypothetical protein
VDRHWDLGCLLTGSVGYKGEVKVQGERGEGDSLYHPSYLASLTRLSRNTTRRGQLLPTVSSQQTRVPSWDLEVSM